VALMHSARYQQSLRRYQARKIRWRDFSEGDLVLRLRQRQPRTPQAITSMGGTLRRGEGAQAWHIQASQRRRRGTHQRLEHPIATSLLSLARISKFFVVNHMPNTPVGDNHVNITSSIKRATRLSPETQVTLGGYCGGRPPHKKWSHFSQKSTCAKYVSTSASSKIRTGRR
jgi:hypothetical protein